MRISIPDGSAGRPVEFGQPHESATGSVTVTRRGFLATAAAGVALAAGARGQDAPSPHFRTRGAVIVPEDLTWLDWPDRAARANLTTIALHHGTSPQAVVQCVRSEAGSRFLERCRKIGLDVEYELHAMGELLPRDLFAKDQALFRMNEKGERVPDSNCCVHSTRGLEIIAENGVELARKLKPTTGRYFFWGDDGGEWCHCPECRGLSPADQALIFENALLRALRSQDPKASLAHLAYQRTLPPPTRVKPDSGIFLEYAPIQRSHEVPYAQQPGATDSLASLQANLDIFAKDTAQVLEYWLDISRFSGWKRPSVKLPWHRDVFRADLDTYRRLGIRRVTSFAAWLDADYVSRFGEPRFLDEYGEDLAAVHT